MITQTYSLDLIPNFAPLVVHVSQYDVGSRTLVFNLTKGGIAYSGSATGATIKGTKPDGNGFMYSMTLDGSTASIVVTEQMTAVAGMTTCEVVLTDGYAILGSANFTLFVEHTALDSETVISDTDIPVFEELTRQAVTASTQAQQYAQQAQESAESIDVSALEAQIASKAPSVSPTLKFAIKASTDGNTNPHAEFRTMGSSPNKSVGFAVYDENGTGSYYDLIKGDGTRYFATVPEVNLKAPIDSPAFTGTPTSTTTATANNSTRIATTAYVKNNLANYAPLASPVLTGTPTAVTASLRDSSTTIATTEFVQNELVPKVIYNSGGLVMYKSGKTIIARFINVSSLPTASQITASAGTESWIPIVAGYYFLWEYASKVVGVLHQTGAGEFDTFGNLSNQAFSTYRIFGNIVWICR